VGVIFPRSLLTEKVVLQIGSSNTKQTLVNNILNQTPSHLVFDEHLYLTYVEDNTIVCYFLLLQFTTIELAINETTYEDILSSTYLI
jgi:hypothetical protein